MKTKIIKSISVLSSIILGFSACKKDFLDVSPTYVVTEDALLKDSVLFEDYVVGRYLGEIISNEGEGTKPGFGRGFEYVLWGSVTDESMYIHDDNSWLIQQGLLAPENTGIAGSIWGRSYRSIREINYALNNIDQVSMSDYHRNLLKAELRFIRAYRYHDLIRGYGRVVLMGNKVYNLSDDLQDPSLFERATLQESMNYVLAELDTAATSLPLDNSSTWAIGRATKGAALALKSRLALYAASPLYQVGSYADAVKASQAVINLNKYSLYQGDYNTLFTSADNNEGIFVRYYTTNANHVCLEIANGPNGYGGWGGNAPFQNLVDDYEMANGKSITDASSGYDATHPYDNRDPRFYNTILYNGAPYRGDTVWTYAPGGKDGIDGTNNWNTSTTGFYLRKFMNDTYPIINPWGFAGFQPWYYFRYAEILLNYAEAANEASGPDIVPDGGSMTARDAINLIRSRTSVQMPSLAAGLTQDAMRTAIRYERRVELAFEEHRYYDVRRWKIASVTENQPAYGVSITKNANGTFNYARKVSLAGKTFKEQQYWLPIPRAEIQASNNKLEQNPGY